MLSIRLYERKGQLAPWSSRQLEHREPHAGHSLQWDRKVRDRETRQQLNVIEKLAGREWK